MRYADTYTPKEVVASKMIDRLFVLARDVDEVLEHDTPSFRARVKKQVENEIERIADKYGFDLGFTLPIRKF